MKLFIKCYFILFANSLFSQESIIAEYQIKFSNDPKKNVEIYDKYLKNAETGAEKIKFTLEADKNNCFFFLDENIQNQDKDAILAIAFSDYISPIYSKFNDKFNFFYTTNEQYFKKNEYLVRTEKFNDWILLDETKNINGFICYKAEGVLKSIEAQVEDKKIIAWYCPDIPFSFGPNGFGNLPGLIIEIQIGNILFGVKKIQVLEKKIKIKTISEENSINFKEYLEIFEERIMGYVKNREK